MHKHNHNHTRALWQIGTDQQTWTDHQLGQINKLGQTENGADCTPPLQPHTTALQHEQTWTDHQLGQTNRLGQINRPGQINKLGQIDKLGKRQTQWYKVFTPLQPHTLANWARQHNGPD